MANPFARLGAAPYQPPVHRCACGCGAYASRGFTGDVWYLAAHVPPPMRFPWEDGFVAAAAAPAPAADVPPGPAPTGDRAAPDLLSGLAPA